MTKNYWRVPKRLRATALVFASGLAMGAGSAAAQENDFSCGDRPFVVDRLAQTYGETRKSVGIGYNNSLVEVFASEETGTWTITVTLPDGQTCMIASGDAFETLHGERLPIPGTDA